jgi:hypothetical protein
MEIVGVVKDIKYMNLRDEVPIQMFIPFLAVRYVGDMTVYVRSSLPAESVVAQARDRVQRLDPNLPLYNVRAIAQRVADPLLVERLIAVLATAFGVLATLRLCRLHGVLAQRVPAQPGDRGENGAAGLTWWACPPRSGAAASPRHRDRPPRPCGPGAHGRASSSASTSPTLTPPGPPCSWVWPPPPPGTSARRASRVDPMSALRYE